VSISSSARFGAVFGAAFGAHLNVALVRTGDRVNRLRGQQVFDRYELKAYASPTATCPGRGDGPGTPLYSLHADAVRSELVKAAALVGPDHVKPPLTTRRKPEVFTVAAPPIV
jgi:hypothetical protein